MFGFRDFRVVRDLNRFLTEPPPPPTPPHPPPPPTRCQNGSPFASSVGETITLGFVANDSGSVSAVDDDEPF